MAHNRGPRQTKEWAAIPSISLAGTTNATILGGSLALLASQTVLRMIGGYVIHPENVATSGDRCKVTLAIGVVSTDAFDAGAASMPDPAGEAEYPWLYWAEHSFGFPKTLSATISGDSVSGVVRERFDIRSMRKMKPRESLAFVVQYVDLVGAPAMRILLSQTRVLFGH